MKHCHVVCRITYKDMRACSVPLCVFTDVKHASDMINRLIDDDKEQGGKGDYIAYTLPIDEVDDEN